MPHILNPSRSLSHPAEELVAMMKRIYRYRMTTTSGGNLSILDDDETLWITPTQVDKGGLQRKDIISIRRDGTVEGPHKPSSEYPFHKRIYAARPDLRAIVHAHPVALVAFSICGGTPNTWAYNRAYAVCGEAGFAPYALPGSAKLGENIAAEFAKGFNCVVLENHGVVVGGATLSEAFARFETLEFTARILLKAKALGSPIRYLSPVQIELAEQQRGEWPEFSPALADAREKTLRQELCAFVRRGYEQRLLTSTQGSFSARVSPESFLITPVDVDRALVEPADLVLMDAQGREQGKVPSGATRLHQAIYQRHPSVQAIVMATPPNATAFSITSHALNSRTIPESYIFLRDVHRFLYDQAHGDGRQIAEAMSPEFPVALIENSGALVLGKSILDAFDRLEVLESTSDALINAQSWGKVRPMSEGVIEEIIEAFLK